MLVRRDPLRDPFAGMCPWHGDCLEGVTCGPSVERRLGVKGEAVAEDHPVWDQIGAYLGQLFHNLTMLAAPQRIIVGGGVGLKRAVLDSARRNYIDLLAGYYRDLRDPLAVEALIVPATLSDRAGVLGAIVLAAAAQAGESPSVAPSILAGAGA